MQNSNRWSIDHCKKNRYRHKFTDVVRILGEWFEPYGGFEGKDVLEFGCGEGTVALSIALQHNPRRIVGVDILDVHNQCLPLARENLRLQSLPDNLELKKIAPGEDFLSLGRFDCIYSWSAFEHVAQDLLRGTFRTLKSVLKPGGSIFLQATPLFYSRDGSHLAAWIPIPWGHLTTQADTYYKRLMSAPDTPEEVRSDWTVYIPLGTERDEERRLMWEIYESLNRTTAPQLERLAQEEGLHIVRDFRTRIDDPIPGFLAETFDEDILRTDQIAWMLQHSEFVELRNTLDRARQEAELRILKVYAEKGALDEENKALYASRDNLAAEKEKLVEELARVEAALNTIYMSRSWKITKPLRWITGLMKRIF